MNIKLKKKFIKNFDKLDSNIKRKVSSKIDIFRNNPFDKILRNHALT
jgi:mRNA-degrading endonuclease RelE of RelBE toxin-antitoxin system